MEVHNIAPVYDENSKILINIDDDGCNKFLTQTKFKKF